MTQDDIRQLVRTYIVHSFLPGEAPESLGDDTRLVTGGVITSLSMLELAGFIEDKFSLSLGPDDMGVAHMDTIDLIVDLVMSRLRQA